MSDSYKIYASKDYVNEKVNELSEEIENIPDVVVAYVEYQSYNLWQINTERGASGEDIKNAIQNDKLAILIATAINTPRPMVYSYHSIVDLEGSQEYLFKATDIETYIADAWETNDSCMYIAVDAESRPADLVLQLPDDVIKHIPVIRTATVGQTIAVKAVDENGKPTKWEAVTSMTEDVVNELIDAKIAAIPNAEEASF